MIKIKTSEEIKKIRIACEILSDTFDYIKDYIKEGITTEEIDRLVEEYIISKRNCYPAFKHLYGFPKSICISLNNEVVHGIPSDRHLKKGDIITLDMGVRYEGYNSDSAWTFIVGKTDSQTEKLVNATEEALYKGIEMVKPGNHVGDIGNAIETYAHQQGLSVVEELCGHGIGKDVHEDPNILNFGKPGTGAELKPGMVICIEPMLNLGTRHVMMLDDDWTIVTVDGKNSAHFEHTILVTETGYEILTEKWRKNVAR